ncbi:excisionase family DNA-binding protein [Ammonicoccus fulvus]|uniref:Excisionase family DNA-binding protein n=1 Tax=Ammonicoccus fulvus TaxID=3138240 RepID=A0ABZ3FLP6_9ACTN
MAATHKRPPTPALSIQEYADANGVSYWTVRRRIADGTIRAYKIGKQVRIPYSELERLQAGYIPSAKG